MVQKYSSDAYVFLPDNCRRTILEHCHQALEHFHYGKSDEGKAFGLVFGSVAEIQLNVAACFPLRKNARARGPYKEQMDRMMAEYAVPSETPLHKRGWVADPAELFARIKECRGNRQILLGSYHMHRVGWEHDRLRDTPTRLDTILAKDSGLLMFIISMVEPARPIIRVFYEGIRDKEIPILKLCDVESVAS